MIEIDDKIVSSDIFTTEFCCDLSQCKGICCVEGNSGAPLEMEEVDMLEDQYDNYKPYMTPEGIAAIEDEGFMVVDVDGEYTTPLVNEAECAFSYSDNGVTLCAIERAWKDGKTEFRKPISCHLYPIRLINLSNGSIGLNYHRWGICASAKECGSKLGVPLFRSLRDSIERRFGEAFYGDLERTYEYMKQQEQQGE